MSKNKGYGLCPAFVIQRRNLRDKARIQKNVYTYGVKIIKDDFAYQILSAMLEALLSCLKEPNEDRIFDLKDVLHNMPVILAEGNKHSKKRIAREISFYRSKWNKHFLKSLIK